MSSAPNLMDPDYSREYGDTYRGHWWWEARERNALVYVRRAALSAAGRPRILDVGSGDGLMWDRLDEIGEVEGIEPDGAMIDPDSRWRSRIEVADFLDGRPRPAVYDLVLMLDVLEHIDDDHAALLRARSLLTDTGRLIVTVPALMSLWSEFDVLNGHHRRYDRAALRSALRRAGLEPLDVRYVYTWPVLPLLLRKRFFRLEQGSRSRFVKAPPAPINRLFYYLSCADHWLTRRIRTPFGSSLVAVASLR